MRKKILKYISIVIILLILIFIVHFIRNIIIFKKIEKLQANYSQTRNHYERIKNGTENTIVDYYYKDGKSKLIYNKVADSIRMITTFDGKFKNTYIDNNENKIAILKEENNTVMTQIMLIKLDYLSDFKILFLISTTSFIKSEKLEGKDCYVINGLDWIAKSYFDKETGLTIRRIDKSGDNITTIDYEYIFDEVTEQDLIVPDISEYVIQ